MLSVVLILTLLSAVVLNLAKKSIKLKDENKEVITDTDYASTFVDVETKTETTQKSVKTEKRIEKTSSNIIIKSNKSKSDAKSYSDSEYNVKHFQKENDNLQENITSGVKVHYAESNKSSSINKSNPKSKNSRSTLTFRNKGLLMQHYDKHGSEMGCSSAEEYENEAARVAQSRSALRKRQGDGDTCYYIESTREFVVVSNDGYIRTYFKASEAYFDKQ